MNVFFFFTLLIFHFGGYGFVQFPSWRKFSRVCLHAVHHSQSTESGLFRLKLGKDSIEKIIDLTTNMNREGKETIESIVSGLEVWSENLRVGLVPEEDNNGKEALWPKNPLFDEMVKLFISLDLPNLCSRHPELIPTVLRKIIEMSAVYDARVLKRKQELQMEECYNDVPLWGVDEFENSLSRVLFSFTPLPRGINMGGTLVKF